MEDKAAVVEYEVGHWESKGFSQASIKVQVEGRTKAPGRSSRHSSGLEGEHNLKN